MKYGKFVFECNCGNKVSFSPLEKEAGALGIHDPYYGAILEGVREAGISWNRETGYEEYMCGDCLSEIELIIDRGKKDAQIAVIKKIKERGKKR